MRRAFVAVVVLAFAVVAVVSTAGCEKEIREARAGVVAVR